MYIIIGTGILHSGDFVLHNTWGTILVALLIPGTLISTAFGIFGGDIGQIVGVLITILLTIYLIEKVFKKPHNANLPS